MNLEIQMDKGSIFGILVLVIAQRREAYVGKTFLRLHKRIDLDKAYEGQIHYIFRSCMFHSFTWCFTGIRHTGNIMLLCGHFVHHCKNISDRFLCSSLLGSITTHARTLIHELLSSLSLIIGYQLLVVSLRGPSHGQRACEC